MRSGRVTKPILEPDPVYGNRLLARFINRVMKSGKKSIAQDVVYKALDSIKEKGEDPVKVFETAINNVGPKMEVKARRVGGASYQVPSEVRGDRRIALAMRWIVLFANKRSSKEYKGFAAKLAAELTDAAKNQGEAVKKRDTVHRMADANRAFAHFKW
ncbi:MAG: 30S ribosomal protein S7 [Candidatus Gottesmanbacteria bacterium GW2011_GWB1_49_7]|uniref:Small ribosomal subunit protein uS7 n=1 Tax=Candidatus Gottesmanbacteria bacterium GW2011_GWB1_49_7 TaxID=1618448 RepID=A0A0G1VXF9_9BACT|nr:MAG: 30S ribosomal protein S7 [Candidatus Gottesmanbacteria bacterium GW2011_GWB1_49_7]